MNRADLKPSAETGGPEDTGWTSRLSKSKVGLAALSCAESTVVPIPLEAIVLPLMVGHPGRAIKIAFAIWLACLAGASLFLVWGCYWRILWCIRY